MVNLLSLMVVHFFSLVLLNYELFQKFKLLGNGEFIAIKWGSTRGRLNEI